MKAQFLIIVSALCFGVIKSNVEASQIENEQGKPSLKRTCRFSEKDPVDQALYGVKGKFLENVFKGAESDFGGRGYQGHQQDQAAMLVRLNEEQARLSKLKLYRGRDTSPEYRAANYALLLQCQSE